MDTQKITNVSFSQVSMFQECEMKYYLTYKRNLERIQFKSTYLVGNMVTFGINLIFKKVVDPIKPVMKYFEYEKAKLRKGLNLSVEEEQDLVYQEMVIRGILTAYPIIYKKFLKDVSFADSEKDAGGMLMGGGLKHSGRMDNLLRYKKYLYTHELKTTKTITPDYIKSIQTNLQTAGNFHSYNATHEEKLKGIIFDVIQKPSIRQKKKESKTQFINRLQDYYLDNAGSDKFYMEFISQPLIKRHNVEKVFSKVGQRILECKTADDYIPNYRSCNNYGRCEMWDICHIGEQPVVMKNYRTKNAWQQIKDAAQMREVLEKKFATGKK